MKAKLPHRKHSGYTLVEAVIAVSLLSMAMVGIMAFSTESTRNLFVNEQKNLINKDIRMLTSQMSHDARQANYFLLYSSYNTSDRNAPEDRRTEGQSGDFMVLVYQGDPVIQIVNGVGNINDPLPVERLVGYYRAADPNVTGSLGPVRRFDITISGSDRFRPVEEILPAYTDMHTHPTVLELSQGLADGRLFYNYRARSVMVNGKIVHGVAAKRVTDTYNFTISPRG